MKLKKDRLSQPLEKPLPRTPIKKAQVLGSVGHLVLSLFQTRIAQGDLLASEPKQTEADPRIGGGGGGNMVLCLFQTRFVQGDLLASEPKQTESEQA